MPELLLPQGPVFGRALIFDKDGVLVDFHRFWGEVSRMRVSELARRTGLEDTECQALTRELGILDDRVDPTGPLAVGTRIEEETIAAAFLYRRGMPWIQARPLVEESFDTAEDAIDWNTAVQGLGNVPEIFRKLSEDGWKLAIATSDLSRNASRHAEILGITPYVSAIAGSDSVSRSKPHADLVLSCCEAMGVPPGECLVIGDTLADLGMAQAANAAAGIGVLSGVSPRETLEGHADAILEGIWELPDLSRGTPHLASPEIDPSHTYVIHTDGASRGNPGPAGIGVVIAHENVGILREISESLGIATNNVAEYQAVIRALDEAERLGIRKITLRSDSELVINQLKGTYRVRNEALLPLYHQALKRLGSFRDVRLEHVPRKQNARADALANDGIKADQGSLKQSRG